jgi:hypothetical protein
LGVFALVGPSLTLFAQLIDEVAGRKIDIAEDAAERADFERVVPMDRHSVRNWPLSRK